MQTILVVEDDMNLREIISYNLDLEGREVLEYANGPDALALLSEKGRQVDLVVLDLGLPTMDGFQVARRIKSDPILKAIPILLCTGKPQAKIIEGIATQKNTAPDRQPHPLLPLQLCNCIVFFSHSKGLIERGGIPLDETVLEEEKSLRDWLASQEPRTEPPVPRAQQLLLLDWGQGEA